MRDQHLKVFVELAEQAEPEIRSHNQLFWLNRLDEELENLHAALEWAEGRDNEALLRLSSALWRFNFIRGHFEDIEWLVKALTLTEGMKTTTRAYALARAGWAKAYLDNEQVEKWLDECMSLCLELDCKPALAIAIYWHEYLNYHRRDDKKSFLELVQPAIDICAETDDHWLLALIYIGIGELDMAADPLAPQVFFQKSLEETRISGDKRQTTVALRYLSHVSLMNGDPEKAISLEHDALRWAKEIDDKVNVLASQHQMACILLYREDYEGAKRIALELYDSFTQENDKIHILNALELLCQVEWAQGNAVRFREYADECVALAAQANIPSGWIAYIHTLSGISYRLNGELEKSNEKITEALKIAYSRSMLEDYRQCFEHKGFIHIEQGRFLEGVKLLAARETLSSSFVLIFDFFPFMVREREAYIAKARATLGDEAFEKAWAEGAAMSTEEAVRLALGDEAS